jgi:hypothetical protein
MKEPFTSISFCLLMGSVFGWIAPISSVSDEESPPPTSNFTCGTALIGQVLTPGEHDALFMLGSPSMATTDIIYDDCIGPLGIFDETTVRTYTTRAPVTYCIIHDIPGYDVGYIYDYRGCRARPPDVLVTAFPVEEMQTEGDAAINSSSFMNNLMNIYVYKCFSLSGTIQDDTKCISSQRDTGSGSWFLPDMAFKTWEENIQAFCNRIYSDWRVIIVTVASGVSVLFTLGGFFYRIWVTIRNHRSKPTSNTEDKLRTLQLPIDPEGV